MGCSLHGFLCRVAFPPLRELCILQFFVFVRLQPQFVACGVFYRRVKYGLDYFFFWTIFTGIPGVAQS